MHNVYGSVILYGKVYTKWKNMKADRGVLGCPIQNMSVTIKNTEYAVFEKGIIYGGKTPKEVHGWIYEKYCRLGREKSFLGFPTSVEKINKQKGINYYHFEHGSIYHVPGFGAFEVHGAIKKRWLNLGGGLRSKIGYPVSDELSVGKTRGRFSRFQKGTIYWHPTTGAYEVRGAIRKRWEEIGGVNSWLGYPVSNEQVAPKGKVRYNNFQNGIIVWSSKRGAMEIKSLKFYLDRFGSKGSDQRGLGGGQDVYVNVNITASENRKWKGRFPKSGDFGSGKEIDKVLVDIPKVQNTTWIDVYMKGMDVDTFDANDHLGTIKEKYNIDNYWGIFDDATHWKSNFKAVYSIKPVVPMDADKPFRNQQWWPFNNFSTKKLSDEQYADTFSDVDQDEEWWLNPFNAAYYEAVYSGGASGGNCFGMCLEAIQSFIGRSIFEQPIYRWGPKGGEPKTSKHKNIINEVNIKQGYQYGAKCIDWVAAQFLSGATHNPISTYYKAKAQFDSGNYPLLIVTPSYWKLGAHAVLPYRFEEVKNSRGKTTRYRIYIADPNVEWTHCRGKIKVMGRNVILPNPTYIDIDADKNTFKYPHSSTENWVGGKWSGGRFYSIPFSILSSQPRTPFWEIFALIASGAVLFVAGDAESEQITDEKGRSFYKKVTGKTARKYSDLNVDNHSNIKNMARIPIMGPRFKINEMYYKKHINNNSKLEHTLYGRGGSYKYMIKTPVVSTFANLKIAKNKKDKIVTKKIRDIAQSIQIQTDERYKRVLLGLQSTISRKNDYRMMEIKDLFLRKDAKVKIQMNKAKTALFVENKGNDTKMTLRVLTKDSGRKKERTIADIPLKGGKTLKYQPSNWSSVASGKANFAEMERINGTVIRNFKL